MGIGRLRPPAGVGPSGPVPPGGPGGPPPGAPGVGNLSGWPVGDVLGGGLPPGGPVGGGGLSAYSFSLSCLTLLLS